MDENSVLGLKLNSEAQIMMNWSYIESVLKLKWNAKNIYNKLVSENKYSYTYSCFMFGLKKILKEKTKEIVQTQTIPTSKLSTKSKDTPVKANSNKTKGFYAETNPDVNQLV